MHVAGIRFVNRGSSSDDGSRCVMWSASLRQCRAATAVAAGVIACGTRTVCLDNNRDYIMLSCTTHELNGPNYLCSCARTQKPTTSQIIIPASSASQEVSVETNQALVSHVSISGPISSLPVSMRVCVDAILLFFKIAKVAFCSSRCIHGLMCGCNWQEASATIYIRGAELRAIAPVHPQNTVCRRR
jgi:hypothetical protein